jgi:hypothetical protein
MVFFILYFSCKAQLITIGVSLLFFEFNTLRFVVWLYRTIIWGKQWSVARLYSCSGSLKHDTRECCPCWRILQCRILMEQLIAIHLLVCNMKILHYHHKVHHTDKCNYILTHSQDDNINTYSMPGNQRIIHHDMRCRWLGSFMSRLSLPERKNVNIHMYFFFFAKLWFNGDYVVRWTERFY